MLSVNSLKSKIVSLLHALLVLWMKVFGKRDYFVNESRLLDIKPTLKPQEANTEIKKLLSKDDPFMVARFGRIELEFIAHLKKLKKLSFLEKSGETIFSRYWAFGLSQKRLFKLSNNAGFFPCSDKYADRFYDLMVSSMEELDLLGSWVEGEVYFKDHLTQAKVCQLSALEPYYHEDPWSESLAGKKVLVIHPFAESIEEQYSKKREVLFSDKKVLPLFELKTLKSVQSIAGDKPDEFDDWFQALAWMKEEAMKIEFDVAIIGCGAYGFPLASALKKAGKQAIHLGGSTQILFGVKGKRWENHPKIAPLMNTSWISPSDKERPQGASKVEGACYW